MSDKPTPDPEIISALAEFTRDNPEDAFIIQLYWRAKGLVERSNLPHAAITFEMLESAFSAFEGGLGHDEISSGYPVKAWREDTVEIPRAWLRVMVEGWQKYKTSPTGNTFGEAFGVEGGGQGAKPVRDQLAHYNQTVKLSNAALFEYLSERQAGGRGSWERAFGRVANSGAGKSDGTIKRASEKHRINTLNTASYLGIIAGCNTSGSGAPDPED